MDGPLADATVASCYLDQTGRTTPVVCINFAGAELLIWEYISGYVLQSSNGYYFYDYDYDT